MKYCQNCKKEYEEDAVYCPKCGEKLKENPTKETKRTNSKRIFIVLLIIILLALVAFAGYKFYQNYQFDKFVSEGNENFIKSEYDKALSSYKEALNIKEDVEVLEDELTTAYKLNDLALIKETLQKLNKITADNKYLENQNYLDYGNTPGNLSNGGNIAYQGNNTYFIDNKQGEADIWEESKFETKLLKTIPFHQGKQPLKALNIWDNKLYFVLEDFIQVLDIERKELKNIAIPYVNNICIYKGNIYYSTSYTPPDITPGIYKCNLDGTNQELIFEGTNQVVNFSFFIYNNSIYLNQTSYNGSGCRLTKISLNDKTSQEIFTQNDGVISHISNYKNICYYTKVNTNNMEMDAVPSNELFILNLDNNAVSSIDLKMPLRTFLINNNRLYFVGNSKLYISDLAGNNQKEIGDAPKVSSVTDLYTSEIYSLSSTFKNFYIASGLSYQIFQPIGINEKFGEIQNEDGNLSIIDLTFKETEPED